MKLHASLVRRLVPATLLLAGPLPAQVVIWNGSVSSDWGTAANWSPAVVPGTGNTAQITSGTASVSDARSVDAIAFSGGTLNGSGTLTLTGTGSTWSGGLMNNAGTLALANGASLTISSSADHDFNARTITNAGTINWTGGNLRTGNGGSFTNSGAFNDSASGSTSVQFNHAYNGIASSFTNNLGATYTKSATGTTTFSSVAFNNSGTVAVTAGTLSLNGGGTTASTGTFNVSSGAGLNIGGGTFTLADGSSLSGAGTFTASAGTLSVTAGSANLSNLTVNGGTLAGGGAAVIASLTETNGIISIAALTLTGASSWSGGTWNSSSASTAGINSGATLTISSAADHDFNFRNITNNGTVNWTGGNLRTGNGGSFTNNSAFNDSASGTTSVQFNHAYNGVASSFTNNLGATYTKSAIGTTTFSSIAFNNSGNVAVTAGTLSLNGGGTNTSTGTFAVNAGAGLNIGGGTYIFTDGASLTGTGTFSTSAGTLSVAGGSANLSNLTVNGGTLGGAGTAVIGNLTETNGIISIAALTLTGASSWSGGTWNSSAASTAGINAGSTLTISSAADHDFNFRNITNNGTVNWTGGNLRTGNSGSFINNSAFNDSASGTTSVQFNHAYNGVASSFTNNLGATYTKSAIGTTTFSSIAFNNSGNVAVTAGTLSLNGGGTNSSTGTFTVSSGAAFNIGGGTYNFADGASLTGAGTFSTNAGTLAIAAGSANLSNLTVNGGTLAGAGNAAIVALTETSGTISIASLTLSGASTWTGGTWNGSGATTATNASGATLTIAGAADHDLDSRVVTNNGIVAWTGGRLRSGHGGGLINNATWNDSASSTVNNDYAGTGGTTFTNAASGTYNKTAAGTTRFDVPFTNNGAINVTGGTLQFNGGGSSNGTFSTGASGSVLFSASYSITDGSSLLGTGAYQVTAGTFSVGGNVNVANFQFSGGTLAGTHTFTGTLTWNGGLLNSAGTTTIASGGTLSLGGNFDHDFNARSIVNNGIVNWLAGAGRLRAGSGSVFTNNLTFNDAASNVFNNDYAGTGGTTFLNASTGTYNKTAAGTTRFDTTFNNNGAVIVTNGTLQFNGGGTNSASGTIDAASGTSVVFSANYTLADASSLSGAGAYALTAGTLTATGSVNVSSFTISGGQLAGTQSFAGAVGWNGGNLNTAGTTTIASGSTFTFSGNFDHDFNTRSFINHGTMNWAAGSGRLRAGHGSVITNHATFNDAASNVLNNDYAGTGGTTFVNAATGTYNKTAIGTTRFDTTFNNDGAIAVTNGTLQFNGGGTNSATGTISAAADTSVVFSASYTLANASSLGGAGAYSVTGGTLAATGNVNVSNFTFNGGMLAGTQTFTGGLIWAGGNFNTGGTTTIANGSTFTISGNFDHDYNSRALVNNGTTTWAAGAGRLRSGTAGAITNNNLFIDAAASALNNDYGGVGGTTFTNSAGATYRKTGSGQTDISVTFINNGVLDLQAGTLALHTGGTFNDDSSATGVGLLRLVGGTLTATGDVTFSNFEMIGGMVAGTHALGGSLKWTGGNFNNAGNTTLTGTFDVGSAADHDFSSHAFTNSGTVNWTAGRLRSGHSGTFTNSATFNDTASNGFNNDYGGTAAQFINQAGGIYNKNAAGTTTFIGVVFTNAGTINANSGSLDLQGGGSSPVGAQFNVASGASLRFTGGSFSVADGTSFAGPGTIAVAGGTLNLSTTVNVPDFRLTAGTLAGSHTFTGGLNWSAGNLNAAGTTTIGNGGVFTIDSIADHDFNAHHFVNNGTVNWVAGRLRAGAGATILNNATWNDSSGSQLNNDYGGTVLQFTNAAGASYNKNGTNTTTIQVPFNNHGQVDVTAGSLAFTAGGTVGHGASFTGAGEARLQGGTFTATGTIQSTSLILAGAHLAGTQTFGGAVRWDSGNFNGGGTTTIDAAGVFHVASAADHDFNAHAFVNNGTVNWTAGRLRSGNSGSILNAGTWVDTASSAINNDYGGTALSFTNNGVYVKAAAGTTTVSVPFINNNGAVLVNAGTLRFTTTFHQSAGTVFLTNGATVQFDISLSFAAGILGGTGTLAGNVTNAGLLTPGDSLGQLSITGNLTLLGTSNLLIQLGGTAQGAGYDFVNVSGSVTVAGTLSLQLLNSFELTASPTDTFTVATSPNAITGTFANAAQGQRLYFGNGSSFLVHYGAGSAFGANNLVLTNFEPVPEPSTYALLAFGSVAVVAALRRRRQ